MFASRAELGRGTSGMTDEKKCLLVQSTSELNEQPWSAPHLAPLFTELTADKTAPVWARRAVRFIHRFTREHGQPPTFREVFAELATHDPDAAVRQEAWSSGVGAVSDDGALAAPRVGPLPTRITHPTIRSGRRRTIHRRAVRPLPTRQPNL